MDCDYCYIYHGQDVSWRDMPMTMQSSVSDALVSEVKELYDSQQAKPQIVFHGGEPLLIGIKRLRGIIASLVTRVPNISLSIQSNGTIYNKPLEQLLLEYRDNLTFSVSVDGFQAENDRHRLGRRLNSVFPKIEMTLERAGKAGVLDSILMVVDIRNDPARTYQFMLDAGARSYNTLLQDGDYDHLPPGKSDIRAIEVGHWLWELFRLYSSGNQNFRIQFFDDISVGLLKMARGIKVPPVTFSLCTITVDTDGEIKQADTFRINADGGDKIGGKNIVESSLFEVANSPQNLASLNELESLSPVCLSCEYLDVCGGGFPSHRASEGDFNNPSIYCSDYIYLFKKIERALCR